MEKLFVVFALLLGALPAEAQLTSVSGTVRDSNGVAYSGASLKMQLVTTAGSPVSGQPTVTLNNQAQCVSSGFGSAPCQIPFQGTVGPFQISPTGTFTINLQDNTLVTPAATQWLFTINTVGNSPPLGTGPQVCTTQITVSGSAQTLSLVSCPLLSNGLNAFGAAGIQLTNSKYNAALDAGFANDASFTNTSNVITSAGAHFQTRLKPAKAGQVVWGLSDVTGLSGTVILAVGTISSVDSDSQIHTSTSATATQTGLLLWGTDDSTPIANFWNDVKTNTNGQTCGVLPSAMAIASQSEFTDNSATRLTADCLYSTGFFTLLVSPSMNWATCPTATSGCFWHHPAATGIQQPNSDYIANVEIWGGGFNWAGLASTNSIMLFQRATVSNVWVWGIGSASNSGLTGMNFTGPVQVFEAVVFNVNTACSTSNTGANQTVALYASFCGGDSGPNLGMGSSSFVVSIGSQYGPNNVGTGVAVAGRLTSLGDVFLGTTGFTMTVNSGGVAYLSGSEVDNTGAGSTALLIQGGGTAISTGNTKLNANGGGGANAILQQTTGTFRTDGNTIITGVTNISPTCAMTTGGGTGPGCAPVAGSTNEKGTVRMTPGTTPGNAGTTTLTFAGTFAGSANTTPSCTFTLANTGTGTWNARATVILSSRSQTAPVFAWDNNAVALTVASTYDVDYACAPR